MTWTDLAAHVGQPRVWFTAAALGAHPMPEEEASCLGDLLDLDAATVAALRPQPARVVDRGLASDPTIYRFYELLDVYGPSLKELIHEEFGDGIMSAINCSIDLRRGSHPDGDRVIGTIDFKFLPYAWNHSDGSTVTIGDRTPPGPSDLPDPRMRPCRGICRLGRLPAW